MHTTDVTGGNTEMPKKENDEVKDELLAGLELWLAKHPHRDKRSIAIAGVEMLSPEEVVEHVRKGTRIGKLYREMINNAAFSFAAGEFPE